MFETIDEKIKDSARCQAQADWNKLLAIVRDFHGDHPSDGSVMLCAAFTPDFREGYLSARTKCLAAEITQRAFERLTRNE